MQFTLLRTLKDMVDKIKSEALVLWFARKHKDTPLLAKVLCIVAVAYALSPIDLIPDFIPVFGRLDDLIIVPVLVWMARSLLPENVVTDSRSEAVSHWRWNSHFPIHLGGLLTGSVSWISAGIYFIQKLFL